MKKVLLTKTQHIRVTAPDIIKKLQNPPVTTSSTAVNNASSIRGLHMPTNVITNTYMQRKSFQSIYEEIFKLLMRLPDKALQQRVIDAINGRSDKSAAAIFGPHNQCKQCSLNEQKPQKVNASTQTETETLTEIKLSAPREILEEIDETTTAAIDGNKETTTAEKASEATSVTKPRKRGRKRNTCVPQVVKRSAAQMALQEREDKQLTPLPPVKKNKLDDVVPSPASKTCDVQRRDSELSNGLGDLNFVEMCFQMDNYINNDNERTILTKMANELVGAHIMSEEGLLPIHDAILIGDVHGVQRQVFVWSKLKNMTDFNDLVSADGEDCLQLALTNDCEPEIVKVLLNAGVLPNYIYDDSNTAVHISIINNIHLESLRELMLQIDLNLLLQTNDDGYTALHIAVRHNRYKMAEIMCDIIDQRQLGAPIYRRTIDEDQETNNEQCAKAVETRDEKRFAKFYERICDRLEHNTEKLLRRQLKHEILNASEARAGNTSLFYAVEGDLEHICYFLLAHLSNPDEENLSGHSPKTYHYEFARVLRINLKVSRIMDKVVGILNGKTTTR
ncbi:uncharacterized protein LOC6561466 [Drosophila grimshawi]|uniref:GH10335 n=1 Tax=Drosophila grimshawi TaxID=7222 RepID=B4JA69_DROGR|nr:uncharacterized protein LOC6561466 [Drosophila grimshawi]EDW03743.1 GH10335 [Drosophila grimshawi]